MDPRHPEQAVIRLRELMKQYDRIEEDIKKATVSAQLGQLEREGGLVVQEMCLVAPRIHEAMMQTSRQRRYDLSHGVVIDMSKYKVPEGVHGDEVGIVEKPVVAPKKETPTKPAVDVVKLKTTKKHKSTKKTTKKEK